MLGPVPVEQPARARAAVMAAAEMVRNLFMEIRVLLGHQWAQGALGR
jgi:hypothetical protein